MADAQGNTESIVPNPILCHFNRTLPPPNLHCPNCAQGVVISLCPFNLTEPWMVRSLTLPCALMICQVLRCSLISAEWHTALAHQFTESVSTTSGTPIAANGWRGMSPFAGAGCWAKGCRKRCCEGVLKDLAAVSQILFQAESASKIAKDMVLAELLQPRFYDCPDASPVPASGGAQPHCMNTMRPCYKIASVTLCKKALLRVLGIGKGRGGRLQKGQADQRYGGRSRGDPRTGHNHAYSAIYTHLWHSASANPTRMFVCLCMFVYVCVCVRVRVCVWCVCVTRVFMD